MIGKLKGVLDTVGDDYVILDVAGVGYVLFCSAHTIRQLPATGHTITLQVETHVREDHIHLYGFTTRDEKKMFLQLTKINGVGSKVALAMLSVLTPEQIVMAIAAQDKHALTAAPGVGPKLALRLLTELKDVVAAGWSTSEGVAQVSAVQAGTEGQSHHIQDAVSALVNLGYQRAEAYRVIQRVAVSHKTVSVDMLITEGLRELAGAIG